MRHGFGSLDRSDGEAVSYERELKRFRKQGWSEVKIERWLEQKEQAKEKQSREDESRAQGSTPELNQWVRFITDLLESGHARRLGLLLHLYHRGIERADKNHRQGARKALGFESGASHADERGRTV